LNLAFEGSEQPLFCGWAFGVIPMSCSQRPAG
jgi:hypothetical protein